MPDSAIFSATTTRGVMSELLSRRPSIGNRADPRRVASRLMPDYVFDADTSVEHRGDGRYAGYLHDRWLIQDVPNGGYSMAVMLRACLEASAHPHPLSVTGHFLSPAGTGEVEIATEMVKPGRTSTTMSAALIQDGRERIRMVATFGDFGDRDGPNHLYLEPPEIRPPFETRRSLLVQSFPDNFNLRIPQSVAGGAMGEPTGGNEIGGTIEFVDGRPPDLLSLPVFADGFPPAAFNLGHPKWTPTLELTIHFWNHPVPGPVTAWFTADVVVGGYHDESGELWDSAGNLVARSRQLARILG